MKAGWPPHKTILGAPFMRIAHEEAPTSKSATVCASFTGSFPDLPAYNAHLPHVGTSPENGITVNPAGGLGGGTTLHTVPVEESNKKVVFSMR